VRLVSLSIDKVRGLPDVRLDLGGITSVIWGPNGAGKSGVVDAIDFLLTGRIGRLVGRGTAGISLVKHGPHIDHDVDSAIVTGTIQLDGFPEPVVLKRCMGTPHELECPEEARAELAEIGEVVRRGGLILTRRDILRYVTSEGGTRADEIQELLNLQGVESIREALYRTRTELRRSEKNAGKVVETAKAEVNVTLLGTKFSDEHLLAVINDCRKKFGGKPLDTPKSTVLKQDLSAPTPVGTGESAFNPTLLRKTVENIRQGTRQQVSEEIARTNEELRRRIEDIKSHTALLAELERFDLTKQALRFVDDATIECPVCAASWPKGHLLQHLKERLDTAQEAEAERERINKAAESVADPIRALRANVNSLVTTISDTKLAERLKHERTQLVSWRDEIDKLLTELADPLVGYLDKGAPAEAVARLLAPEKLGTLMAAVEEAVDGEAPSPTAAQTAWDMLTHLEESVRVLEDRIQDLEAAKLHRARSEVQYDEYQKARDAVLQDLYNRVAERFAEFYRILHDHEKNHFIARLQPQGAALNFEVDFLGRGAHPPHALHSEGHQDSMGLCLFLALNEELSRGKVGLIVLDDVVMSVDAGHRKDVCRLLKESFPHMQFVITTHDRTWAKQLKQEQIVDAEHLIEFTNWTVEKGPRVHHQVDLWDAITRALEKEDVPEAAFKLRRGSEDFFESVCDSLRAQVTYNSATQWQLGDWLLAAMAEYRALLQRAQRAARSWENNDAVAELAELGSIRKQVYTRTYVEQWAINASVHYNNWENMSREDFSPVVDAFKDLQDLFKCSTCGGLLQKLPEKGTPEIVKCPCGLVNWNLKQKAAA